MLRTVLVNHVLVIVYGYCQLKRLPK